MGTPENHELFRYILKHDCVSPDQYKIIDLIGSGTYGEVYKATKQKDPSGQLYAIKTFRSPFSVPAEEVQWDGLREFSILRSLKSEFVVEAKAIIKEKKSASDELDVKLSMVMNLCEHDLARLLRGKVALANNEKKNLIHQLLCGLDYLKTQKVMHRDIKPPNILISNSGSLKIADFGMAKRIDGSRNSLEVVSLHYRAPEIMLGDSNYDTKIDLWAAGIVIAQLWTRHTLFQGNSEMELMESIAKTCGPMTPDYWPGVDQLCYFQIFGPEIVGTGSPRQVKQVLSKSIHDDDQLIDLIDQILTPDPSKRIDVTTCLKHPYFLVEPPPCSKEDLAHTLSSFCPRCDLE